MKPTLGFIGLGLMGAPMAMRLLNAGYTVQIYNRTKEKAGALLERGAVWKSSPEECAANADMVFSMVTNDAAVREIAAAVQSTLHSGAIHIDCSTVSPKLTAALEKEYHITGRSFLHSPVLGGIPQATDGVLLLFVGGKDDAFNRAEPVLKILGSKIWRFPAAEQASSTKLTMNSFIAGMTATLAQALTFAEKAHIGGATILDILQHSALNAPSFQVKGKSMLERNFTPRFIIENLLKDTNLFIDAASSAGMKTPVSAMAKQVLEQSIALGFGKEDYSAIIKSFEANSEKI